MHRQIRQEQTRMLYANRTNVLSGSFAIGIISTIILWQSADRFWLALWFLASLVLVTVRWQLSKGYDRKTTAEQDERYQYWAWQFTAGSFLNGLLWGIVPLVFYTDNVHFFALILTMHAGYVAAAALATSIYLPTLLAFAIPSSMLFFIGTLVRGGIDFWPHALIIVAYAVVLVIYARRNSNAVLEQVSLRLANAALMIDLRKQKDKAELAMLAKNRFLAAASHDLRQPVHALGLFVSSLESRDDPDQRRYILDKIKQATGALGSLFHGLLDISKLDANVLENNPGHKNLDELMLLIESQFHYTAVEKGLEFKVPTASGHVAFVDDDLLERILRNLVSNAIKYTSTGYVSITIEADEGNQLAIAVEDSGTGIDKSEHINIFSEYHQLTNPERDRQKGLGLGLAIVQRLCELTNIPISVESERGRGSTFTLKVPSGDKRLVASSADPVKAVDYFPLSVVVIDDEQDIIDGMQRVLNSWQCHTTTATSIEAALDALAHAEAPDVIIADFRLRGELSGLDAIKIIREEFNTEIPALLITGDTAPERLRQAISADVSVLHKPVEPAVLKKALHQLVHEFS